MNFSAASRPSVVFLYFIEVNVKHSGTLRMINYLPNCMKLFCTNQLRVHFPFQNRYQIWNKKHWSSNWQYYGWNWTNHPQWEDRTTYSSCSPYSLTSTANTIFDLRKSLSKCTSTASQSTIYSQKLLNERVRRATTVHLIRNWVSCVHVLFVTCKVNKIVEIRI